MLLLNVHRAPGKSTTVLMGLCVATHLLNLVNPLLRVVGHKLVATPIKFVAAKGVVTAWVIVAVLVQYLPRGLLRLMALQQVVVQ